MSNSENTNYTLLGDITTYNKEKEELYNKIRSTEINYLINPENQKTANDIKKSVLNSDDNTISFYNNFNEYYNKEYENNISIGNYFNDKILELNNILEDKKKELDKTQLDIKRAEIYQSTTKSLLNSEYNKITIHKIYKHLLLVSICILILINLLIVLNKYNLLESYLVIIISIILILLNIIYIILVLYSKYPRESEDYYRFKFKLDNANMDVHYKDISTPTVNIDNKIDELVKNN